MHPLLVFWERCPALLLGISLLAGIAASLISLPLFALLFLAIALSAQKKGLFLLATALFAVAYFSTPLRAPLIQLPSEKIEGSARFSIDSLKMHASPFSRSLAYRGVLEEFSAADGTVYKNLPCTLFHSKTKLFPPANCTYQIEGTLLQKAQRQFVFKPKPRQQWTPLPNTRSFAQWRYETKQSIAGHLKKKIKDKGAQGLLIALATADSDDRTLKMQFGKIGLQHLLAISGFHFALAALFLQGIFHLLFPRTLGHLLLIAVLTLYYFYLGDAPSIQRAYIALTLFYTGRIFYWQITGLNALGAALCIELLINPLATLELGFQLSFLCTLAILLFYTPIHNTLTYLMPRRNKEQLLAMKVLDKHAYFISHFLRQSISINLAVSLISLPVVLYYFHQFPLLGLFYNLFIPLGVTLSLFLLFTALLLTPLPLLSDLLHALNDSWTAALMRLASHPPAILQFTLRTNDLGQYAVLGLLCLAFFVGIFLSERERLKNLSI